MKKTKTFDAAKRRLLTGTVAVAGMAIAPGVTLIAPAVSREAGEPASDKQRWGLLIDSNKCDAGCDECVVACKTENGWDGHDRPATDAQWIRKVNLKNNKTGATHSLPVMCQHCENPPCVDVCPTGASMRRADGIVLVDKHICIGCRYCMLACPYKARSFIHEDVTGQKPHMPRGKGTVESCTLCAHRIDIGGTPACVEACGEKAGREAMMFGDLNDPNSEIAKELAKRITTRLRADLGLEPGVHYRGLG